MLISWGGIDDNLMSRIKDLYNLQEDLKLNKSQYREYVQLVRALTGKQLTRYCVYGLKQAHLVLKDYYNG